MLATSGGLTLIELDSHASERSKPFGVITADCSGCHEMDDGIAVTPLDYRDETYRVQVFAVDTSALYYDEQIVRRALTLTESRYHDADTGYSSYAPMLDRELTQNLHFTEKASEPRKALVVSFIVGTSVAPSDAKISFGHVDIQRNYEYNTFGGMCRDRPDFEKYGRAAAFIMAHLGTQYSKDEEIYDQLINVPRSAAWKRGANINQAFMVAANHLVGGLMRSENNLAIYRSHDTSSSHLLDALSPQVARYSTTPTEHYGLGLDAYTRVTSPLRRLEDFVMHGLLRQRAKDREVSPRDIKLVATAIQRLNQRIIAEQFSGPLRMAREDLFPSRQHNPEEPNFDQIA
jgi:hypothetical protein